METEVKEAGVDPQAEEVLNRQLIDAVIAAGNGECKNASAASSVMIRRRIRENGFSRRIIPPKQVSDADLNRLVDSELPVIIEDMEGDQPGAKSLSFNDTPDTQTYKGERFGCALRRPDVGHTTRLSIKLGRFLNLPGRLSRGKLFFRELLKSLHLRG